MINSKDLFRDLRKRITLLQDASETESILYRVLEEVPGITRSDIIGQKAVSLTAKETSALDSIINRINQNEPVQYILGKVDFLGREFAVNPSVLIPRPETELLIEAVFKHVTPAPGKILDIGTGSGCIAITLSCELPQKQVYAFDISEAALKTAKGNADKLNAQVTFQQADILNEEITLNDFEFIVSNPPYVAVSEKDTMNANVLNYEPHLALFVPDNDPLIFYKVIAEKGVRALRSGGRIIIEINERFGKEVKEVFTNAGLNDVRILKDLEGKDRIVSAVK
ncbi:MAG TPA: peptide chain release factor N(5)-glutamine methyltransferase [Cyclobacteriaceae bacterium]|nr:peptide chain release factor N(5)-glutamine methyltransferase [Cyclobacteriaceae bacterium]HMV08012.1 peptide chain release factor N(5)-glutamine methyltransferase [Cyclobacteriaceae bacterium]HMV91637.1 peptide chain release factor N(5)-glutamine methyltransferase [Cyclobacteriaceae bacterium]HMX00652.1 peptide chain release factor N(5)-glutamine methyltransferase [Cyclobacteriaceae bacterium]HMX49473.1 peptide chain release factor N(5)-glutamine methyltransferase [Cyclobacteriaceae bacteri